MQYLSRLRLSTKSSIQAVADLLLPSGPNTNAGLAKHKLLWSAFSDDADRRRDFLWREGENGEFFTLSARPPEDTDIFEKVVREFKPTFSVGDRLNFQLRVNATRAKIRSDAEMKGKRNREYRVDVVMDALRQVPQNERAARRMEIADQEGRSWMMRQGETNGFRLRQYVLDGYRTEQIGTPGSWKNPQFGVLDLTGMIEVTDPVAFSKRILLGFGREKSYGCGLMMLRRA